MYGFATCPSGEASDGPIGADGPRLWSISFKGLSFLCLLKLGLLLGSLTSGLNVALLICYDSAGFAPLKLFFTFGRSLATWVGPKYTVYCPGPWTA